MRPKRIVKAWRMDFLNVLIGGIKMGLTMMDRYNNRETVALAMQ